MSSSRPIALSDSDENDGGGSDLPELTFKSTARRGKSQTVVLSDDDDDDLDGHNSSSSGYAVVATSSRAAAFRPALSSGKQRDALKLQSKNRQAPPVPAELLPAPGVSAPTAPKPAKGNKHQARVNVEDSDATDDNARVGPASTNHSNGKKLRKSGSTRNQTVVESEDQDDSTMDEADRPVPVRAPAAAAHSSASKNNAPFRERLSRNIDSSPMYSKTFKGKVKGSNSTSIPLNDERFDSGPEDEEYESDGRGSAKKSRRRARSSNKENEDDFIVADDAPIERARSPRKERTSKSRSSHKRDKGKEKEVARLREASASSDLPEISDILGSSGKHSRRNGMEKMQSSRKEKERKERKKEKHRKRVVRSPEPTPEPVASSSRGKVVDTDSDDGVRVAHSAQPAAKSRKRKRSTTKGTRGKNHRPLFIESEDEDAPRQREVSDEEEDSPPPAPKRKSKNNKKKSRKAIQSSDSGSSSNDDSDSPAPPEDSDEDINEVENLKLDTDQVIEEKLRPKDDRKERRLDKLKLARAAKQRKIENQRRGIIDSDDDNDKRAEAEEISSDEDGTDEQAEDVPDLDDDDESLIDDEDDGEDARRKAERNLPVEFSSHAKQPLEEHFKHFIAHLVYIYVFPKSKTILRDPKRLFSARAIENEITGVVNSAATSSIWQTEFRKALDAKPYMSMEAIHYSPGCNGCNRDRTASQLASISGAPYDRTTWEPLDDPDDSDSDAEDPEEELQFNLGRFCAEKAQVAHALMHFAYHTKNAVHAECDKEYRLPRKDKAVSRDRDERNRKKDKEAQRILSLIDKGRLSAANAMWDDLKLLLEQGRRIGTSSAWGKYVLDE